MTFIIGSILMGSGSFFLLANLAIFITNWLRHGPSPAPLLGAFLLFLSALTFFFSGYGSWSLVAVLLMIADLGLGVGGMWWRTYWERRREGKGARG